MPIGNADIASKFIRLSDLLEIEGANPFRIRAYRNAARTLQNLPREARDLLSDKGGFPKLEGIGKDLAGKIAEIVRTGKFHQLDLLERSRGKELFRLLHFGGLGPKKVRLLSESLNIKSLADLKKELKKGALRSLPGFGEVTEKNIREAFLRAGEGEKRIGLFYAEVIAAPIVEYLRKIAGVREVIVAGSIRRKRETVGDIDILVVADEQRRVCEGFVGHPNIDRILSCGITKASVKLRDGPQVDVRVVKSASFGSALQYFTGSKAHTVKLRKIAQKKGIKINEYGVYRGKSRLGGEREEDIYHSLGMPFIEPELREDSGEIEAATEGNLPRLVTLSNIKGDLHTHTNASDGSASLMEMAQAAMQRGYSYLGITDHSKRLKIANGLDPRRLRAQIEDIERLNSTFNDFALLKGIEVDILEDGSLDLPESILKELDFTICSIHSGFNLSLEKQTSRVLRAMDNPYFKIFGHPTSRLLGKRDGIKLNFGKIILEAKARGHVLEINGQPDRLDLSDTYARMAHDEGVLLSLGSDAHKTEELSYIGFALNQARRGWLEQKDILNTLSLEGIRRRFVR